MVAFLSSIVMCYMYMLVLPCMACQSPHVIIARLVPSWEELQSTELLPTPTPFQQRGPAEQRCGEHSRRACASQNGRRGSSTAATTTATTTTTRGRNNRTSKVKLREGSGEDQATTRREESRASGHQGSPGLGVRYQQTSVAV